MKAYEVKPGASSLDDLIAVERPDPRPGAGEVVIRVRAASLNARDQGIVAGRYPQGSWLRSPHMSAHKPFSVEGCTILIKTGHLM